MPLGNSDKTNTLDQQEIALMYGSLQAEVDALRRLLTLAHLRGNTDGTLIGNDGDRLKTSAVTVVTPVINKKLVFEDAQLARDTSIPVNVWTTFHSYTGAGQFLGVLANLEGANGAESSKWYIRVVIDDTYYPLTANGILISDLINSSAYGISSLVGNFCGLEMNGNIVHLDLIQNPIQFSTKVEFQVKRVSTVKKFKAGQIVLIKDAL